LVDLATLIGIFGGLFFIAVGITMTPGSDFRFFLNPASVMITLGGAVCSTLITFPLRDLRNVWRVIVLAFREERAKPAKLIVDFRRYADIARRDGILALESVTQDVRDPFLVRGLQLAVDGTDPEMIQTMMRTELEYIQERHNRGIRILKQFAIYAPAFGMIGTLIGLIVMLGKLHDPSRIGPAMSVAIVTTFYGAILSYLVATPLAEKLTVRNNEEALVKEMMIKGIMSLQSGDNPSIVEQKMKIFLSPKPQEGRRWE